MIPRIRAAAIGLDFTTPALGFDRRDSSSQQIAPKLTPPMPVTATCLRIAGQRRRRHSRVPRGDADHQWPAATRTVTSLKSSSRWRKRSKRFHLASSSS
jgi:hypothetical protein